MKFPRDYIPLLTLFLPWTRTTCMIKFRFALEMALTWKTNVYETHEKNAVVVIFQIHARFLQTYYNQSSETGSNIRSKIFMTVAVAYKQPLAWCLCHRVILQTNKEQRNKEYIFFRSRWHRLIVRSYLFYFFKEVCHLSAGRQHWPAPVCFREQIFWWLCHTKSDHAYAHILLSLYLRRAGDELIKSRHVCAWDMVL